MNKETQNLLKRSMLLLLPVALLTLSGCGQKVAGGYNLTQSGGQMQYSYGASTSCNQISLTFTENSNQVMATGSNACFTETLVGSNNNGSIQVTSLTLTPVSTSGGYSGGYSCIYTGTLIVQNNIVTGTLTPSQSGTCGNYPLTISGTKVN